jgi:hypothetical protein
MPSAKCLRHGVRRAIGSTLVLALSLVGMAEHSAAQAEESLPLASTREIADQLPCRAEYFTIEDYHAFVLLPAKALAAKTWVWYAPTVGSSLNQSNLWMFRQFLENGIAIAGVDVGESCGNPAGRAVYSAFWQDLHQQYGLAERACLLV